MANTYERHDISDEFWAKIELLLPGREGIWGGNARDNRPFLNATFWIYERVHLGVICRRATAIGKYSPTFLLLARQGNLGTPSGGIN